MSQPCCSLINVVGLCWIFFKKFFVEINQAIDIELLNLSHEKYDCEKNHHSYMMKNGKLLSKNALLQPLYMMPIKYVMLMP